jgi:hypothetical protein
MFRLTDEPMLERIEGALLRAKQLQTETTSWWWNLLALVFIVGSMAVFLYTRATRPAMVEEKRIPFEPQVWYSAARNVHSSETERQRQPLEMGGLGNWDSEAGAPV